MIAVIVMFLAGVILVLAEFFLPGLILGILGFGLIMASTITGVMQFPEYAPFIIAGELCGFFFSIFLGFYLMTRTKLGDMLVLKGTMSAADGYTGPSQDVGLVGQIAKVYTTLRPSGTILVDKQRIDAISEGTFIDAGTSVLIIKVEGNRVVVEEMDEAEGN
jgi:membrane-bound serine protease (ClpP class)